MPIYSALQPHLHWVLWCSTWLRW